MDLTQMQTQHTPSQQTMKAVRIELLKRDLSFSAYCRTRGYTRQNVAAALTGKWTGEGAKALVQAVLADVDLAA